MLRLVADYGLWGVGKAGWVARVGMGWYGQLWSIHTGDIGFGWTDLVMQAGWMVGMVMGSPDGAVCDFWLGQLNAGNSADRLWLLARLG